MGGVVAVGEHPGHGVGHQRPGLDHDVRGVDGEDRPLGTDRSAVDAREVRRAGVDGAAGGDQGDDRGGGRVDQPGEPVDGAGAFHEVAGDQDGAAGPAEQVGGGGPEPGDRPRVRIGDGERAGRCGHRRGGDVDRHRQVDGAQLADRGGQDLVDPLGGVPGGQDGSGRGDLGVGTGEAAEVAVAERVVQQPSRGGGRRGRRAGDLDQRYVLGVGARDGVDRAEFAHAERRDQRGHAPGTGVAVRGVPGAQLVRGPDPLLAPLGEQVVEQGEAEVAGNAEQVLDAQLVQSPGEVLRNGHGLHGPS